MDTTKTLQGLRHQVSQAMEAESTARQKLHELTGEQAKLKALPKPGDWRDTKALAQFRLAEDQLSLIGEAIAEAQTAVAKAEANTEGLSLPLRRAIESALQPFIETRQAAYTKASQEAQAAGDVLAALQTVARELVTGQPSELSKIAPVLPLADRLLAGQAPL